MMDAVDLIVDLPWHMIYDFLPLRSILSCRAATTFLAYSCSSMAPESCALILSYEMSKRKVTPAWYLLKNMPQDIIESADVYAMQQALLCNWLTIKTQDNQCSSAFDRMLRCFQIFHNLPEELRAELPSGEEMCHRSRMNFFTVHSDWFVLSEQHESSQFEKLICPICRFRNKIDGKSSLKVEIIQVPRSHYRVVEVSEKPVLSIHTMFFDSGCHFDWIDLRPGHSRRYSTFMTISCKSCYRFGIQSYVNQCKECFMHRKDDKDSYNLVRKRCSISECYGPVPCYICSHPENKNTKNRYWKCEVCHASVCNECLEVCNPIYDRPMRYVCPCRLQTSYIMHKRRQVMDKDALDNLFYGYQSDVDKKYIFQFLMEQHDDSESDMED